MLSKHIQHNSAMPKESITARLKKSVRVREKRISLRRLIPNAVTVLALCAGLTSIRLGLDMQFENAVGMIVLAAFLDVTDGWLARLLKVESRIGAHLDSLVDFLNFGIAPVLLIYIWNIDGMGRLGWLAILTYTVCAALRLARFNVESVNPDRPIWMNNFFTGIPSPAAGLLVLLPLVLTFVGVPQAIESPILVGLYTITIGLMMVSNMPTFSLKKLTFSLSRKKAIPILLIIGLLAGTFLTFPWIGLLAVNILYLVTIPLIIYQFNRLQNKSSL